jgi:carboxylesterase type B
MLWVLDLASNTALYDQRLATEWMHFNIHRFGNDGQDVTFIGESSGARSSVSHLSPFGGNNGTLPFKEAPTQSPIMKPTQDPALDMELYKQFQAAPDVASFAKARALSSPQLAAANAAMIWSRRSHPLSLVSTWPRTSQ